MIHKEKIIFILFITCFLFLRLFHFRASLNYGSDQGLELLDIYQLYQSHKITLIGPPSSFVVEGRTFFVGSALYYLLMPLLIIFHWNPVSISYLLIILQLIIYVWLYRVLKKRYPKSWVPAIFSIIYIFSPTMVEYSRFFWNPNFLIPLSGCILTLLLTLDNKTKIRDWKLIVIGFLLGLGMQFHYSFFLAILATIAWLILSHKITLKYLILIGIGWTVGFSPLIIFELRHNYYNLRTLMLFITQKNGGLVGKAPLNYYFFALIPFIIFIISWLGEKMRKANQIVVVIILMGFIVYSLTKILPTPKGGFTLPPGWNYEGMTKVEQIILQENKKNYNIVDILTGDTRALGLRYLLTISGNPPISYLDYPKAQYLYVYSKVPYYKIAQGTLWEIDSVKPIKLVHAWNIQNGINLYLVEKTSTSIK